MSQLKTPAIPGKRVIVRYEGAEQFQGQVLRYNADYKTAVKLDNGETVIVETATQRWTVEVVE